MKPLLELLSGRLHALLAAACLWLLVSSPWVGLYRELTAQAGWVNLAHAGVGLLTLPLVLVYLRACTQGGLWRTYFPWLAGQWSGIGRDLRGMARGERPMNEGAGLFAAIEGLLLLALLVTAVTGALWLLLQGGQAAVLLRAVHIVAAQAFAVTLGAHVLAVSLHLVDLVRG
jgi:hypothetical protein